jgi:LuxR family maltose regulon positive regulatory protein
MLALVERSLLAASRTNGAGAESLVVEARTVLDDAPMCRHPLSALVYAASARHALRHGDLARARADRTKALDFAPLGHALPWYSVQTSLELARVDLALLDPPAARTWVSAAGEVLSRRPLLGALGAQADALRDEASRVAALSDDQQTTPSAAELRLLPLLTTHLTFREIGERLGVTRSTVKTQAISMYRKLGVSSRSEAIERAVELGLVDGASELRPVEFIPSG